MQSQPVSIEKTEYDIFSRIVKEQPTRSTGNDGQGRSQNALVDLPLRDRDREARTKPPEGSGGGERDRTDDPLLEKQVLSQLSYTP